MYIAIAVIVSILCGVVCHTLARQRGAKPVFWGVMGIVFGPFAIPFALYAKPNEENT